MHARGRTDLAYFKSRLLRQLGPDNAKAYWALLRDFAAVKLSKAEFDEIALQLLGRSEIILHNEFIGAIIANAHSTAPPRSERLYYSGARDDHDRKRKAAHSSGALLNPRLNERPSNIKRARLEIDYEARSLELPDLDALKKRMTKTAAEAGLSPVSEECGKFMRYALDRHLKEILSHVVNLVKLNRARNLVDATIVIRNEEKFRGLRVPEIHVITPSDLHSAIQISPRLLGEGLPVTQERVVSLEFAPEDINLVVRGMPKALEPLRMVLVERGIIAKPVRRSPVILLPDAMDLLSQPSEVTQTQESEPDQEEKVLEGAVVEKAVEMTTIATVAEDVESASHSANHTGR